MHNEQTLATCGISMQNSYSLAFNPSFFHAIYCTFWSVSFKLNLKSLKYDFVINFVIYILNRVASGPGISGNLEKSGNFVTLGKNQGKVGEFREIRRSQRSLMRNWEK